ncbi:helix-turn-helix domain-containing protein [Sphingomonas sp. XXL09]|uniref:helix-turn-helix domain-containing protein n=1 Tax=Sphingomonas sp. XXL09 TaxID=3457787 RepID=UPI00406BBD7B
MPQTNRSAATEEAAATGEIDRYRSIVFPNRVRDVRRQRGIPTLLGLAARLPDIPYVRLSKIERGEVVAKAAELRRIASALDVAPEALLLDIDAPDFDIADWAVDLQDWTEEDIEEDRFAVLLAAAIRARREADRSLSIPQVERLYGIAPVILSRLENAFKPIGRWNAQAVRAVCKMLGADSVAALREQVLRAADAGEYDRHIPLIAGVDVRRDKTRARIATLRDELAANPPQTEESAAGAETVARSAPPPRQGDHGTDNTVLAAIHAADSVVVRLVPVFGVPLRDGLMRSMRSTTSADSSCGNSASTRAA